MAYELSTPIPPTFWEQVVHQKKRIIDDAPDTAQELCEILEDDRYDLLRADAPVVRWEFAERRWVAGQDGRGLIEILVRVGWELTDYTCPALWVMRHERTRQKILYEGGVVTPFGCECMH